MSHIEEAGTKPSEEEHERMDALLGAKSSTNDEMSKLGETF
jgi:hypothetical protein